MANRLCRTIPQRRFTLNAKPARRVYDAEPAMRRMNKSMAAFATFAATFAVAVVAAAATLIVEIFIRCFTDIDDFA